MMIKMKIAIKRLDLSRKCVKIIQSLEVLGKEEEKEKAIRGQYGDFRRFFTPLIRDHSQFSFIKLHSLHNLIRVRVSVDSR